MHQNGRVVRQVAHRPNAQGPCLLLCVDWHPSGEFFVVGDYGNHDTGELPVIQFWTPRGEPINTIELTSRAEVRSLRWNGDGTRLASTSDALKIWSRSGAKLHEGQSPTQLWGVSWNPTSTQLITTSEAGHVTLWTNAARPIKQIVAPAPADGE